MSNVLMNARYSLMKPLYCSFFALSECPLPNKGCTILKEDCDAPCEAGKFYQCVDSCDRFARCWAGFYFVQQCYKSHFDSKTSKCQMGQGHCTDQEWNSGASTNQPRRKFSGVRGFGIGKQTLASTLGMASITNSGLLSFTTENNAQDEYTIYLLCIIFFAKDKTFSKSDKLQLYINNGRDSCQQ